MLNLNKWNATPSRLEKSMFAVIVSISIVLSGMLAWQNQLPFQVQASPELPPMTLTVVGSDGSQLALNETDIGNLESYRAYGGYKNSLGILKGLGNYTGVPIKTLCDMMGGIRSGYRVRIIASDNYSKDISYEELNGNLVTFDNVTGEEVQHNQTLTPILAYYYNDLNLSLSDGPLKVAIVGPEGLCTNSTFWVKQVVRLELHPNLQSMNLTVVALNGTELTLNETTISNLPALRAVGASRNQLGIVKNLGNYTGPSLNTFCNLAGGLSNDNALRVTAPDNYTKTFSYEEVNGAFTTYDNVTGQPVQHNQSLTPILAYHFNDANLSLSDGPLRIAIIGSEGLATSSNYWVKQVVKLEIRYRDDVAITAVTPSKTAVGQNLTCNVNVTAENQGGYDETFNVTVYANQTAIGTQMVTLSAGNSTTITFTWNTTSLVYGNYTISTNTTSLAGETDISDNSCTDGIVTVTISGDINGDAGVGPADFALLSAAYGSTPGKPKWNPNADIDSSDRVGPADFALLSAHYGQHYT
ncbi:MAG TPA: CARDB domain-containing protein [Candidatus Acidoferrum sp.]|nr:CARDB domain-containing protein [Candidatus Acidoferrum sp.]